MTNGIFKRLNSHAYARTKNSMSTQSATVFEWSVKLIGSSLFNAGIATQFQRESLNLEVYDENAILYRPIKRAIVLGSNTIHSNLTEHKTGDIISFKFQPHTKKLVINSVRV